jgi:hypothetical protein
VAGGAQRRVHRQEGFCAAPVEEYPRGICGVIFAHAWGGFFLVGVDAGVLLFGLARGIF